MDHCRQATPACTPHRIASPISFLPSLGSSPSVIGQFSCTNDINLSPSIAAPLLPVWCGVISSSSVLDTFDAGTVDWWGTLIVLPLLRAWLAANGDTRSCFYHNGNASRSEGMSMSLTSPSHRIRILTMLFSALPSLRDVICLTFFGRSMCMFRAGNSQVIYLTVMVRQEEMFYNKENPSTGTVIQVPKGIQRMLEERKLRPSKGLLLS